MDPERFSERTAEFIHKSYILKGTLSDAKAELTNYLSEEFREYINKQREDIEKVNMSGGVGGTPEKALNFLIRMMKKAGFSNSQIGAILERAGLTAGVVASYLKGEAVAEGSVSDRVVVNATRLFAQELTDRLFEGISAMKGDGDLTKDEILHAVRNRLTPAVSSFLESAEDLAQVNKAEEAGRNFASAGRELLKEFGGEAGLGAIGLMLANAGPELAKKGIDVLRSLREKVGPEDFKKILGELDDFREKLKSEVQERFGRGTAKHVDDFLKSVGREVIESGKSLKEAVEEAKNTAVRTLVSRGLSIERAQKIVERIADVAEDVVGEMKYKWFGIIGRGAGMFTAGVPDGFAWGGMDMEALRNFQEKFGLRFDFRTRTFVVEDPVKFEPLAERIGAPADPGPLNPEENERALSAYWQFVKNYNR
ncbi:MAG: hypothetical protein Q9N34_09210 [Aquificota bacterium]|nr:hypothetical protein [Aquificota bacterium]